MSVFEASGKLVLLGEYAVVDGGSALAMAVEHGVRCTVAAHPELKITTPDGDDRFVRAALLAIDAPAAHYVFTARSPLDTPEKPGMGGSAAATVAALRAGGFRGGPQALTDLGIAIHRGVQGSGSGIDVAASAHGGTVRFESGRCTPLTGVPVPHVIYSGTSAKTGPRVTRYLLWRDRAAFVDASNRWVDRFSSDPIGSVRGAWRSLVGMSEAAGVDYRTPAIDTLVTLAEDHGGAAKPSGAGGGDCVLAWVDDPAFLTAVARHGFRTLPIRAE